MKKILFMLTVIALIGCQLEADTINDYQARKKRGLNFPRSTTDGTLYFNYYEGDKYQCHGTLYAGSGRYFFVCDSGKQYNALSNFVFKED